MSVDIAQIPRSHLPDRAGIIRDILRTYPDATNIVSEFIQNAEDVNFETIKFEVSRENLLIENDGDAFSTDDYHRLVVFAQGKWGETGKIGRFGVGFLSAYHITDSPTVLSNGVRLVIRPDGRTSRSRDNLSDGRGGTTFVLPWRRKPTKLSAQLGITKVTADSIRRFVGSFGEKFGRCALFLGGKRIIEGWERNGDCRRLLCRCTREVLGEDRIDHEDGSITCDTVRVSTEWFYDQSGSNRNVNAEWLVFSQDFEEDYVQKYGIGAPGKTKVSLAFKLRDRSPDEVGYLHAFLPTRIRTGLQFNLNADFAPRTGRDDIMEGESSEAGWNEWLMDCLGRLSVGIVDQLKLKADTPGAFYDVLPVECAEDRPYLRRIVDTFVDGVKDMAIVRSSESSWVTRQQIYRVDPELRRIVERSGLKFVAKEIQNTSKASTLFDKIYLQWFQTKDLVTLLGQVPRQCPLRKAPRFVRGDRKIGAVYRYLVKHEYDGMREDLKVVSLCPDQFDTLHAFNCSGDPVYWADARMRRVLAGSDVPLVKEVLWNNHKPFIKSLVTQFRMDDLIRYLDSVKDACVGKVLEKASTPVIGSLPKVRAIYEYLRREDVYKNSEYGDSALEGTPLCIAQDHTIYAFNSESPPAYCAPKRLRAILAGSGPVLVNLELQQRYGGLLAGAGVREFGVDDVLQLAQQGSRDGIPLRRAARQFNAQDRLLKVYDYLRRTKLSPQQTETLRSTPLFLTSKGNLRPLVGSNQGPLALRSGRFSDPLRLDNLVHDVLSKHRELGKWLRDFLEVRDLKLSVYISGYLIPQYAMASEDVQLELLRMLRGSLKTILQSKALQLLLQSAPLVRCQDGEYRCGPKVCFRKRSIDLSFGSSYNYPGSIYAHGGKHGGQIRKEDWGDLFRMLGVRQIPDPEAVIRAAESLTHGGSTRAGIQRAGRLIRFICKHWPEYKRECEDLKALRDLAWLPAEGDSTQLRYPYELYIPCLQNLLGTQVPYLALRGIDEELADFLLAGSQNRPGLGRSKPAT